MLYIFDMGGVLTNNADIIPNVCSELKISREDFRKYCGAGGKKEEDIMSLIDVGLIDAKTFWKIFSERSGIKVKTDWLQFFFHPAINEGTLSIIKRLKESGNRVVCGTNTIESHYRNHMERADYSVFDQTYASCFMGVEKPNEDFWKIILTAEGIGATDTVFIDDMKENVDSAARLGIRAIQFTSADALKKELFEDSLSAL